MPLYAGRHVENTASTRVHHECALEDTDGILSSVSAGGGTSQQCPLETVIAVLSLYACSSYADVRLDVDDFIAGMHTLQMAKTGRMPKTQPLMEL